MGRQITAIPTKDTINCRGKLVDLSSPKVMGILNVTPDSFYDGGRHNDQDALLKQAEKHVEEGAGFLDIGAVSTRPGAADVTPGEEMKRLIPAVKLLRDRFPDIPLSIDTFRSQIAIAAVEAGADMVNDISGGRFDENMFETIAKLQVPYVLMHIKGTPGSMQDKPEYENVVSEVLDHLVSEAHRLSHMGVHDVIIDPGFGFGKTVEHNFQLLRNLDRFRIAGLPILVGISRKRMINSIVGTTPDKAMNGTTVLNTIALRQGARILRVHDVKEAVEAIKLVSAIG